MGKNTCTASIDTQVTFQTYRENLTSQDDFQQKFLESSAPGCAIFWSLCHRVTTSWGRPNCPWWSWGFGTLLGGHKKKFQASPLCQFLTLNPTPVTPMPYVKGRSQIIRRARVISAPDTQSLNVLQVHWEQINPKSREYEINHPPLKTRMEMYKWLQWFHYSGKIMTDFFFSLRSPKFCLLLPYNLKYCKCT